MSGWMFFQKIDLQYILLFDINYYKMNNIRVKIIDFIDYIKKEKTIYEVIVLFCGSFNLFVFIFSIADMIAGASWKNCYLKYIDIYHYLFGSFGFGYLIFASCRKIYTYVLSGVCILGGFCVLFWGMTIIYGSEKKDCDVEAYRYLYYRTLITLIIWSVYLISLIGGFLMYNFITERNRKIAEINVI